MAGAGERLVRQHRRRTALLLVMVLALGALAVNDSLHRAIESVIAVATPFIQEHAIAGAISFVLLSALSAMVVFFSTAAITPVAVEAFGPFLSFLLLWLGWILGGVSAYAIGRLLGRRVAAWLIDPKRLVEYTRRARGITTFGHVLLFQVAVPSEIPGYVLGVTNCPFRTVLVAMALGELPYAIGAVVLGQSFLEGNVFVLLGVGLAGVALTWLIVRRAEALWSSHGQPVSGGAVGLSIQNHDRPDSRDEQSEVFVNPEADSGV